MNINPEISVRSETLYSPPGRTEINNRNRTFEKRNFSRGRLTINAEYELLLSTEQIKNWEGINAATLRDKPGGQEAEQ